jgi:SH3 domain-containing YSC84-like protein 1
MRRLIGSKFQLGADASAAAGPVGRHASANTDWKMDTKILTYSRAKGVFAGLTLIGAAIPHDNDSTEAILEGRKAVPASAGAFLDAVRDAKAQSIASN